jgi:hypothetical protein
MIEPARFMERPTSTPTAISAGRAEKRRAVYAPKEQALPSLVRYCRFSPVTIGFWLGGAGMGMGGCLLGALMPYRHPVAVAISVLWWGIYFGCFGAGIGALVSVFTDLAPTRPSWSWDGAGKAPTESELDSGSAKIMNRAAPRDHLRGIAFMSTDDLGNRAHAPVQEQGDVCLDQGSILGP